MKMPFGKYQGRSLDDIPEDYLWWVLDNCRNITPALRRSIEDTLWNDQVVNDYRPTISLDLVGSWYRTLAMEFHPDRRGSDEAMKAVNRGRELLLELMENAK